MSKRRQRAESETAMNSRTRSRSDTSSQSDASSTQSSKSSSGLFPAASQARLNPDTVRVSADVPSEQSSSQASEHYSEDFDEASVASSMKSVDVHISRPKKAKKSPPS